MVRNAINELQDILDKINNRYFEEQLLLVSELVGNAFKTRNKILLVGNGGSAAEAQHMAAEYTATLSSRNFRNGLPAIALTTDTSFLTAWSNDFGVNDIFARQVETLGCDGDVLFAYSTSGNSENIIRAAEVAKSKQISVVGLTGGEGGKLKSIAQTCFSVPSENTARIQECHTLIGHIVCAQVEKLLGFPFAKE